MKMTPENAFLLWVNISLHLHLYVLFVPRICLLAIHKSPVLYRKATRRSMMFQQYILKCLRLYHHSTYLKTEDSEAKHYNMSDGYSGHLSNVAAQMNENNEILETTGMTVINFYKRSRKIQKGKRKGEMLMWQQKNIYSLSTRQAINLISQFSKMVLI